MGHYNEKKTKDRKIAILAIWVYAISLGLFLLFFRISYSETVVKDSPIVDVGILLTMADASAASVPAPKPKPVVEEPEIEDTVEPDIKDAVIKKKAPKKKAKKKKKPREVKKAALFNMKNNPKNSDGKEYKDNSSKYTSTAKSGVDTGQAFSLEGRSLRGVLPKPRYTSNSEGRVVIDIHVNKSGEVIKATFRASSSTTNDSRLVAESIAAAKLTTFNADETANFIAGGTLTYHFKVR